MNVIGLLRKDYLQVILGRLIKGRLVYLVKGRLIRDGWSKDDWSKDDWLKDDWSGGRPSLVKHPSTEEINVTNCES